MKTKKQKLQTVIDDILCDICDRSTKNKNDNIVSGLLMGDFANKMYEVDFCEACFNKTLSLLRSSRRQNNVQTKPNPLEGTQK
jgi:hypothetical protein